MFDFKLTKKGDLDLDYDDSIDVPQKISFVVSDYDVQRIQFVTMPLTVQQKKPADQRISFKLASIDDTSFVEKAIQDKRRQMLAAAKQEDFQTAALLRDEMLLMEDRLQAIL